MLKKVKKFEKMKSQNFCITSCIDGAFENISSERLYVLRNITFQLIPV
jgi:hypothetical protein